VSQKVTCVTSHLFLLQHVFKISFSSTIASIKRLHHSQTAGSTTCNSQGSVVTVLKWGGQKYSHLHRVSSWCCTPKIIKIGAIQKRKVACFYGPWCTSTISTITTAAITATDYSVSLHGENHYITLCPKKNIPDIFGCNLKTNYQILIICGTNISDTTWHQMTI